LEGSFDRAICSEVLEHLPQPEKVLINAYEVLKQGNEPFTEGQGFRFWLRLGQAVSVDFCESLFDGLDNPVPLYTQ